MVGCFKCGYEDDLFFIVVLQIFSDFSVSMNNVNNVLRLSVVIVCV